MLAKEAKRLNNTNLETNDTSSKGRNGHSAIEPAPIGIEPIMEHEHNKENGGEAEEPELLVLRKCVFRIQYSSTFTASWQMGAQPR